MAKKRLVRWILILGVLVLLLLVAGAAVALNSGVQTSVALHFLQQQDPQAKVGSVSLGLGGGEVHGLEMTVDGSKISMGSATLEYSLSNIVLGHTKVIESVVVKDFIYDASQPKPATAAKTAAAAGAKNHPPSVLVKKADITGTVLLPQQRKVQLSLSAQNVGAGGDGKATGTIIFQDKSPDAKVPEMHLDTQVGVSLDDTMAPKNLDLIANFAATLPGQVASSKLQAHLTAKPLNSTSGEFTITLAPPDADAAQLVSAKGTYGLDGSGGGEFDVNFGRAQIEAFAMGYKLPNFNIVGKGQFTADAKSSSGSVKATLQGSAGNLEVLRPELAGVGDVQLAATVDMAVDGKKISGKTLSVTLAPMGGKPVLALDLLKPVTLEYGDQGVKLPPGAGADLARLTLTQAPAAWLTAALPKGFTVTGQGFDGEVMLGAHDDGAIMANTTKSLTFAGINVKQEQATMLDGGALELDLTAQYLGKALTADVRKFYFEAHSVAASGLVLNSVSLPGKIMKAQFAGKVSMEPGEKMPTVTANGHLAVALDVDNIDQKALGKNLPAILPAGLLVLDSTVDVSCVYPTLVINTFQTTLVKGPTGQTTTLAAANTLQKVSLPLGKDAALPAMSGNLATIEINGFPLAVAQLFLPSNLKISGNPLKGKILLVGAGGAAAGLVLHTTEPFTIENAQYAQDNDAKFSGVTITATTEGSWAADDIKANVHLQATAAAGVLLDAVLDAAQLKDVLTATVTASGKVGALAAQPIGAEWRNFLADPKPEYSMNASLTRNATTVKISTVEAQVVTAGAASSTLADIKLLQPFTLTVEPTAPNDPKAGTKYAWPHANGDLLSIKLADLPAGLLALALPGYQLSGRGLSGDVLVHGAGDGNYTLVTNAPIAATGLTVSHTVDKNLTSELVHDLTFTFKPAATFDNTGLTACSAQDLLFSSANMTLARGSFDMTSIAGQTWPQQATASLQLDLAQLLRQPVLSKYNNLAAGMFKLDAAMSPDGAIKLNADVSNWTVKGSQTVLTHMVFQDATGKFNRANNALQFTIPVKGESKEGPTDCVLNVDLEPSGDSHKFSLNVSGNNLVIDDLMAVKEGLFPPPAPAPATVRPPGAPAPGPVATTISTTPDKAPIWGDLQGQADIQLKSIRFHSFSIIDFKAGAQVSPTQAALPSVTGTFEGAPLALNGTLAFNPAMTASPYALQAKVDFKNFDAGAYFKARTPGVTPPVEGNFSITGGANGSGANIDDLIDRVQFNLSLQSTGGTFHMLDLLASKVGVSAGVLKAGAALVGGVLNLLGKNNATSAATKTATAITGLVGSLDALQYTQLVFEAQRGADLNVKLSQFNVTSAQVQLTGSGQVTYVRGVAIPDQALDATLVLNTKGDVANDMQLVHLLGVAQASGYNAGPKFQVVGTMQHPDYSFLKNLITQVVTGVDGK